MDKKSKLCQFPKPCETSLCGWIVCPFKPIENTNKALLCEYYRLQTLYLTDYDRYSEQTLKIEMQLMNVEAELVQRGTLYPGLRKKDTPCQ